MQIRKKASCDICINFLYDDDNLFCGMVDRLKVFSYISSRDHCQRSLPLRISDTPRAGFEPAQNLSLGLVEWCYAVAITTTPRCQERKEKNIVRKEFSFLLLLTFIPDFGFSTVIFKFGARCHSPNGLIS